VADRSLVVPVMIIPVPLLVVGSVVWSAYAHVTASIAGHPISVSLGMLVLATLILAIVAGILWLVRSIIRDTRKPPGPVYVITSMNNP
jgi:hypothetical protein